VPTTYGESMSLFSRCCVVALLSCACSPFARAADRLPPPPDTLHAAPLHLVVLNERTRMQVPYVGPAGVPTVVSNTIPAGALLAGNLIGGLVVAGIEHQRLKEARATVQPAYDLLRQHQCLLDGSTTFMDALEPVARLDAHPVTARRVLTDTLTLDDAVSAKQERHLLLISYALTPDLGHLLTTVHAMYAPAGENGKDSRVSWDGQITVAASAPPLPAKTPEHTARLVAETHARWIATGGDALVDAANRGDRAARREVAARYKDHQDLLKQARADDWSLHHAALEHARGWVADDCSALRQALQANASRAAALLPRVYAQDLPPFPKPGFWKMPPIPEEIRDGMVIRAAGPMAWLSWPEGGTQPGKYPSSSWMLEENEASDTAGSPEEAAQGGNVQE